MDFLKLIKKQRVESQKEAWSGTFVDYLNLVQKDSTVVKLAARRLVDAIESSGVEALDDTDPRCRKLFDGDKVRIYNYFKDDFYGHERVIAKLMRFLKSASLKGTILLILRKCSNNSISSLTYKDIVLLYN